MATMERMLKVKGKIGPTAVSLYTCYDNGIFWVRSEGLSYAAPVHVFLDLKQSAFDNLADIQQELRIRFNKEK